MVMITFNCISSLSLSLSFFFFFSSSWFKTMTNEILSSFSSRSNAAIERVERERERKEEIRAPAVWKKHWCCLMVRYGVSEGVMMMELMSENRLIDEKRKEKLCRRLLSSQLLVVDGQTRIEKKAIELIHHWLELCVKCLIETDDDHRHQMSFHLVYMVKSSTRFPAHAHCQNDHLCFRAVAISDTRS